MNVKAFPKKCTPVYEATKVMANISKGQHKDEIGGPATKITFFQIVCNIAPWEPKQEARYG
jgi:hypothetical protein